MPTYSIKIPGAGEYKVNSPEELTNEQVYFAVQQQLQAEAPPQAPDEPQGESGFMPGVKSSIERLKGDYQAFRAAQGDKEAAALAAEHRKRAGQILKMPEFSEHPLDYVTSLLGSSVPYMAAPLVAGAVASPAGVAASLGLAGLASGAQFTGSGLSRQLEEGTRPEDLNVGRAVAAAIPSAALDVIGLRYIPGIRGIFGAAGLRIGEKEAAGIVSKYIVPAFKTAGVEGGTEAAQAVFERLQAGLELDSPEARAEYFQNFLGGAVLGGVMSVPGTFIEGGRGQAPAEPTAAPEVSEPLPESPTQEMLALPAPDERLALPAPEEVPALPAPETVAAETTPVEPIEPVPQPNVVQLMDRFEELKSTLDPLAEQIQTAQEAGDMDTARSLQAEYRKIDTTVSELETQIAELGGVTEPRAEVEAKAVAEAKRLDTKIAALQNKVAEYRRSDVRDYDAADKAEAQIEKLQAQREEQTTELERVQKLLTAKETPKDETISLFPAEAVVPEPKNMLTLEKRDAEGKVVGTMTEKDIADQEAELAAKQEKVAVDEEAASKKQAEADALLENLTALMKRGPQEVAAENKAAALAALNEAREELRRTQEASAAKPSLEMDDAVSNAQYKVAQLTRNLQGLNPQAARERYISEVNTQSEKLNQLYADIDATRGGFERVAPPPTLFGQRNVLYTRAANTGKPEDMLKLLQFEQAQGKKAKKEEQSAAKERLVEALQRRLDLPGRVSTRVADEEKFQSTMDEIARLQNKITGKLGNAKQSVYEKAESMYKRLNELEAVIEDKDATVQQKGYARRSYSQLLPQYEALLKQMSDVREQVYALYSSLYDVKDVKKASEIDVEKQAERDKEGRTLREKSREQKRFEKAQKGTMKASPARVARELGEQTDEYKKAAAAIDKAKNLSEEERVKRKAGIAEAIGRKNPWYGSQLMKETRALKESEKTAGEPVKQTRRTTQETRRVAKLGTMSTGTPESQERATAKQSAFEAELNEDRGTVADQQRKQELLERAQKVRAAKEGKTAVGSAMQKAAMEKVKRDLKEGVASEKEQPLRGSEIESKDLTKEQVKALEANDLTKAYASIVEDETNSDANRAVATALEALLDATDVEVHNRLYADDGGELLGQATSRKIDLSREGLTQETLLHEGVHSAAERVIRMAQEDITQLGKEQQNAYRELERLYNAIKKDPSITSKNAKSNISEFAAEALSNEKLQSQLRAKKWTLGDAFKSFTSYLLQMIGVKRVNNMLDASFAAVEALMIPSSVGRSVSEEAKALPKDVGVFEKTKGVFGFKSQVDANSPKSSIVAQERGLIDELKANFLGLSGRVQLVDKFAAISEAFKKGLSEGQISSLEAGNAEYFLRFGENRSQYAQQALTNGPIQMTVSREVNGKKEYVYKSKQGANLMRVYEILQKAGIKNSTELDRMFTVYMAGKRANQVGWEKLWVGDPDTAKKEYADVMRKLQANDNMRTSFAAAAIEYRSFNNGLVDFLVQTGALTKDKAAELKAIDYVPYYRADKGTGEVELFVDKEMPIRIGNIKDEPQLHALIGDNTQILPLSVSAVQNAFMLTDMALRNQRVKDTAFILHKIGIAQTLGKGKGPTGRNTVRFKKDGIDHFVVIDTDMYGIPASLIVRGLEGIQTTLPMAVQLMGKPANLLRKFVTRNPTYAVRQIIRDPLTAWMATGTDGVPVLNSLKELSSMVAGRSDVEKKLMESGAISSNVFTGDKEDMQKFLRDISAGKSNWEKLIAKADAFAMQGDAATRAVVYRDSLAKGMSEQQALLRTLESMNFSRRGLMPTLQLLGTMIPFFNAQIQGLDVMYRAFTGQMPFSEQLKIRQKLYQRGLLMAAGTIAYAAMMEDDEAYKKAKPEERLANWFVYIPGFDEPVRVPIPFEFGYLFKALPEAVWNASSEDARSSDITKGMGKLLMQSNPFSLPQAIKPLTEVYLGKSFFGGDIESQREVNTMLPTERYRAGSTEIAKLLGGVTGDAGLTPIKVDYLIRGYTGNLGVALAALANPLLNSEADAAEKPTKKLHEKAFVGGLFQPVEGRGTLDAAYERMLEIQQAKGTYKRMLEAGKREEAAEFLREYRNKLAKASLSGRVQQKLGELSKKRRQILESTSLSEEQKTELLNRIDTVRNNYAERFLGATE